MTGPSGAQERPVHDNEEPWIPNRRHFIARSLGATAAFAGFVAGIPFGADTAHANAAVSPADPLRHAGTALQPSGGARWVARHDLTDPQYRAQFDQLVNKEGYRLVDLCGYEVRSQARYAAIWEQAPRRLPQWSRHEIKDSEFRAEFDQQDKNGYRLVDVCGYAAPGLTGTLYAAIWERADGRHWGWIPPSVHDVYQVDFNKVVAQGYRPVRVSGFSIGSQPYFTAVLEKSDGIPWRSLHGISSGLYQHDFDHETRDGYRPVHVGGGTVGYLDTAVQQFSPVWERREASPVIATLADAFMKNYEVPGLSLAIAKDGQLAYAQGFGLADKSSGEKVATSSLFRIASLSKQITSVTVMKLIEEGKLKISDTVFGTSGILGTMYGKQPYKANIENITVQHLLEHALAGWPGDPDPMFNPGPEYDHAKLISEVLDNREPPKDPGAKWGYSNFGYCVLGRVIEKVTSKPYDVYVKERVLAPCRITGMQLAGNTQADRRPGEVVYYSQSDGNDPYSMQVTRMDSHGGWLATAIDLMRFAVRVDGFPAKPDILSSASITTMTTPSKAEGADGYAKGWQVNTASTWWHFGALPGNASLLARTGDGFCWSALSNTWRTDKETRTGLDNLMWAVHDKVDIWPPGQDL